MTIPEWVAAANKILRENKSLSYKEAEEILVAAGHQRPKGIKQNGSRKTGRLFARASKKTPEQSIRRRNHEKTSTPEAAEHVAKTKLQRKEVEGIAEYAGLPGLHTEHLVNQDSADAIRTGAAGDLVENIPADSGKSKTSLESIIRNDYNNEYVVGISADNFRIIPKESYDELVDPDDLPGFNINEIKDLDSQLKKGIEKHRGGIRFRAGGLGAIGGMVLDPETIEKAVEGDYNGAAQSALMGEVYSQGVQRIGIPAVQAVAKPFVEKFAPIIIKGATHIAPIIAPLAPVLAPLSVGATIGDLMNTFLPKTSHTSGRGEGRAAMND